MQITRQNKAVFEGLGQKYIIKNTILQQDMSHVFGQMASKMFVKYTDLSVLDERHGSLFRQMVGFHEP